MSEFFDKQDDLTKAKINFYQNYIEVYLIKLLTGFNECFIADLFCGPGKNGKEDGSPLVLINKANYILKIKKLEHSKVYIQFNDKNIDHINDLINELNNIEIDKRIIIWQPQNKDFEDIYSYMINKLKNSRTPKFFFLDPFTYTNVKTKHLKKLMSLKNAEVLLFLPVFHTYRFKTANFDKEHKTIAFLKEFTTKGVYNYKNIDEFVQS